MVYPRRKAALHARRAVSALVGFCMAFSATMCLAAGPRVALSQDSFGFSARIDDMTATEVVRAMGAHFGFRVVDRAPAGPRMTCELRAPTLVALLARLLAAGSYTVVYREGSPRGTDVVESVLLIATTPVALSRPQAPAYITGSGAPSERPGLDERLEAVAGGHASSEVIPAEGQVGRAVQASLSPPAASPWSRASVRPGPPALSATAAGSPQSMAVPDDVRRFIAERVDALVDATREATLSGASGR